MRQPHIVQVQLMESEETSHGVELVPTLDPIDLKCSFRRTSSGEVDINGRLVMYDARLLTTTPWPGGPLDNTSQISIDGLLYEMDGVPRRLDGSRRGHVTRVTDRLSHLLGWMKSAPRHYPDPARLRACFDAAGLRSEFSPLAGDTPFNNWLVVASRD